MTRLDTTKLTNVLELANALSMNNLMRNMLLINAMLNTSLKSL